MEHEILAIKKDGTDYGWFSLITKKGQTFTVYNVSWEIDESRENAFMLISKIDEEYENSVKDCTIIGSSFEIKNLMYSLGYALPNKPNDNIYINTLSEATRQLNYLIDEMKDLVGKKQTT